MRKIVIGHRLAIRLPDGALLAVPPLPPHASAAVRVRVFEYVLRRQPGLAEVTAQMAAEAQDVHGDALRGRLASIMGETPYKTARAVAAA